MDTKNIIAAISLSAAVIIIYGLFFAPDPQQIKQKQIELKNNTTIENSEAPKIEPKEEVAKISRKDAISNTKRVKFENENIIGTISLEGGIIDDLIFKNYTETLNGSDNVVLLNPRNADDGYFVETGWVTSSKNIDVPNSKTLWKIDEGAKLSPSNPIKLHWTNNQGIKFEKIISIDNKFLFTIEQYITNTSNNDYDFYPYGQIIRNKAPKVTDFYILHEGLIGVFDDQLVEKDYDDIEDKKYTISAKDGWTGITDKFWIVTMIPEDNKQFRSEFDYNKKFKANFIESSSTKVKANETKSNRIKVIVAAKEVDVIDEYSENSNISKFDLVIDWGWFYFLTKNFFFLIHYFFELTGNYGIAIILVTVCIRVAFFPLANYGFRSMAKMKVLQPEMARLKELYKDDKVKLQQEMMSLYKKEKVNPVSGCLPILIQIPFFFAIYKVLFVTIESRHQPFFGWIKDLSERDPTSIFNLFGLIPWDPPSFLIIGV